MPFPRWVTRGVGAIVNPIAPHFVGHGSLAEIEHVGRNSGLARHTPVRAFRSHSPDTIVIGANHGRSSDWIRNVERAGSARIRYRGETLELGPPQVVPFADAADRFPAWFAFGLRHLVHTEHCVVFPVLGSSGS